MRVRTVPVLLTTALLLSLAGCLVESTLDEKGGGTLKTEVRGGPTDTIDKIKARFTGPGVEVTKATMDDKKNAVVEIKYDDFTKLGALKQYENVTFTLTEDLKAKTRTATAVAKYARPVTLPDDQLKYFGSDVALALTVPGEIVKTDGKSKGKTATWSMPLNTLLSTPTSTFSVTYKHDGPPLAKAAAATDGTPAAATPAAGTPAAGTPNAKAASAPAT